MPPQAGQQAPVFGSLEVGKDNLRRIIGPQGTVIKGLEADSGSRLSIDDAGLVHIYSPAREHYRKAVSAIEGITGASLRVGCFFSNSPREKPSLQHLSQLLSLLTKVRGVLPCDVLTSCQELYSAST